MHPLITREVNEHLRSAQQAGAHSAQCSLDLQRSTVEVGLADDHWQFEGKRYPYLEDAKERTIYRWNGVSFEPMQRFRGSLIKLVPTPWGAPTFEIDGIKMLPTAKVSPFSDAEQKVALIQPAGKRILDTCGGLGYFAAWCLQKNAAHVMSFEKNEDVIWLRSVNPWSPSSDPRLTLTHADIAEHIVRLPDASFDAALHDPPRFGIAGELYSQAFYDHLARVLKRKGKLFHYTGTPNKLTTGRDVPREVAKRLMHAGFTTQLAGDGILAVKR